MQRLRTTCALLVLALFCAALAVRPAAAQQMASDDVIVASENVAPPTVEYQGELPPLIDRQTFFGDPQYANAQLSPDGEHVAFTKPYKGRMNVWVKGVDEPFDAAEPVTADTTRPVPGYFWTQNSERILYVQDKGGNENYHIYAVDPDAEAETELGVPPAEDLTPYENVRAQIIGVPESTPGEIIVGLNDRNPKYHDVYRLDLGSGERTLLYKNTTGVASWHTDLEGNLRLAMRQTDSGGTEILRITDDTLKTVYACSFEESCGVIRFHKNNEQVYMTTNKGPDVDLQRLVLFDPETRETELVASDPENEVDFGGAIFSDATDELLATVYVGDRKRVYPKDDEFEADYQFLKENLDGEISFGSSTEDEQLRIVTVSSDVDPGSAYLFNRETQSLEKLYESRPELPSQHLAEMKAIRYEARDGTEIPAYLTLPKGVESKNLPVVLFPHGGPWGRDTWGYDSYAQFFANRGYAVLQPNFRSSVGYGQAFLNAGNEEWGTGVMQHDLTDGVQYLIDQGIADPNRVGIFGGSYGGYATLAGLTFTPDVYAAGASYVGPSNLITLLNSIPPYWAPIRNMMFKRVGNPNEKKDRKRLKQQSPFFHADQIDDPLLVIQGANDPRVKKQESDQIVVAARDNGVPVQYLVAPGEGHGFRKENNRLAVAAKLERFFGTHLGGRYQTDATPPIQQRLDALAVDPDSVTLPDTTAAAQASASDADGFSMLDGSRLEPATLSYDATMKMGGRSLDLSSTQTFAATSTNGSDTWTLVSKIKTPRGTQTDSLIADRSSLLPMSWHKRGGATMDITFTDTSASGEMKMRGQSVSINESLDGPTLAGGTHDLIALGTMPLEPGFSTTLRIFSPQDQTTKRAEFEVTGTETVKTPGGSFETYAVDVNVGGGDITGTVHLRKKAPHYVVKSKTKVSTARGTRTFIQTLSKMSTSASSSGTR